MKQKNLVLIVMGISLAIGLFWDSIPLIKNSFHFLLDPTIGMFFNWNVLWGMIILVFVINVAMMLVQKYTTDQKTLKDIKKEQKEMQKAMKECSHDPEKMMEMNKKQMKFMKDTFLVTMKLTMRSWVFTLIPLIALFRWLGDYFAIIPDYRFFGIFSWFWFYFAFTIILSMILKKVLDVA